VLGGLDPNNMSDEMMEKIIADMAAMQQQAVAAQDGKDGAAGPARPDVAMVSPTPGICIKSFNDKEEKVFINICHSDLIPSPPKLSDEEMVRVLATGDNSNYTVPMSVGEPHAELDTAKAGCTVYDCIMSTEAFEEIKKRAGIREFFIELAMAQIEHKYTTLLSREFKILTKRRKMGTIEPQRCRVVKKKIREVSKRGDGEATATEADVPVPEYQLMKEPPEGRPEFYVLEVTLPTVRSSKGLALDICEDRLELNAHPRKFALGLDFEHPLNYKDTGAQFNKKTHVLTVTIEVAQEAS